MAVVVVAAAGLTGCADRPNDLDTYYDDPTTEENAGEATRQSAPPATRQSAEPSPAADTAALDEAVRSAVLTDADVASEGALPAPPEKARSGCLGRIPVGLVAPDAQEARWEYPTGSGLEQLVTGYAEHDAAAMLTGRVHCAGEPLTVPAQPAVDSHAAWCEAATCAVLLADGNVLSAVQVTAGDQQRAAEAVRRLAPIAATRLATVQPS